MLHKYNNCHHYWLQWILEAKETRTKAYVKMFFSAKMTSKQLSESLNYNIRVFFKEFQPMTSISDDNSLSSNQDTN